MFIKNAWDFASKEKFGLVDKAARAFARGGVSLAGRATRAAIREATPVASKAAWAGYGVGMRAGFTGAAMAGNAVRAAGMIGGAAAYTANLGLKMAGAGIKYSQATVPFTNLQVPLPHLKTSAKMILGAASLPIAVGMGVNDYVQRNRWSLSHAQATGQVEIEREDFLGATGSLTLASYNNRNGGGGGLNAGALRNAAAHHADDFLLAGLHTIF